jgi:hypothetical protein
MSAHSTIAHSRDTSTISPPRKGGRRRIELDPATLERLAREQPTQLAVATELDISQATLTNRLLDTPELRRAWERGRAARAEAKRPRPLDPPQRLLPEPPPAPEAGREFRAPEPLFTGTPTARVLASLAGDERGRTFGELMNETGLGWHQVVETVNRLMRSGLVVARNVCGTRRHFLAEKVAEAQETAHD